MSELMVPRSHRLSRTAILLALSAAILSIGTGLRQSLGLFLTPMSVLGISASGPCPATYCMGHRSAVHRHDSRHLRDPARIGRDRPGLYGGFLIMTSASSAIDLDIGGFLVGLGIAGTGLGVVMGVVSRAVPPERRSQPVGTVAAIESLGTIVLAPLGQWLIEGFGWRSAMHAFAASPAQWRCSRLLLAADRGGSELQWSRATTSRRSARYCAPPQHIQAISR
jgi:hypothetical protein